MSGFVGFGYHDGKCTRVHFSDEVWVYDYCLICRTHSMCFGRISPDDTCEFPVATISEEDSRVDELRVDREHDRNHTLMHYQETDFTEPVNPGERRDLFWHNYNRRYHYCPECQRYTNECPLGRGRDCQTEHTTAPLDDSKFIQIAWAASAVDGPCPVTPTA